MNFKKISIMLMLSSTVWAQSATPAAGEPKDRDEAVSLSHGAELLRRLRRAAGLRQGRGSFQMRRHPESFPSPRNAGPMLP